MGCAGTSSAYLVSLLYSVTIIVSLCSLKGLLMGKIKSLNCVDVPMKQVWPDGNQCAACFTFDLDAEWVFMGNDPSIAEKPRIRSQGEYVWNSDIIPRLLDVLDTHDLKATFFVVAMNAVNHPDVVGEIVDRGHEVATHGWKHEAVDHLPYEEEKQLRLKMVKAIENATGVRPVGNRVAGGEIGPNTHDILKELGFLYDSSMRGCDMPYKLENGLVIVPSYYEMDDFHLFADYPLVHTRRV